MNPAGATSPTAAYLQHVGQLPQHPSAQQSAAQQSVQQVGHLSQHLSPQQPLAAEGDEGARPPNEATNIRALRNMVDMGITFRNGRALRRTWSRFTERTDRPKTRGLR